GGRPDPCNSGALRDVYIVTQGTKRHNVRCGRGADDHRELAGAAATRRSRSGHPVHHRARASLWPRDHPAPRAVHRPGRHRRHDLPDPRTVDARRPVERPLELVGGAASAQVLPPHGGWTSRARRHDLPLARVHEEDRQAAEGGRGGAAMTLTDTGQSRIRGYLFVLERSLRSFLPPAVVADAIREVETHILDRLAQMGPSPDERASVE